MKIPEAKPKLRMGRPMLVRKPESLVRKLKPEFRYFEFRTLTDGLREILRGQQDGVEEEPFLFPLFLPS